MRRLSLALATTTALGACTNEAAIVGTDNLQKTAAPRFNSSGSAGSEHDDVAFGTDGISYTRAGSFILGSNGESIYRLSDRTMIGSDGTTYSRVGNTTIRSDGVSYRRVGNTTLGSDGTTCHSFRYTVIC